jgi:hypothetical protein
MKTTAIMIEILVAGVLVLLALFLLAGSLFPSDMQSFLNDINKPGHWLEKTPFLIFIFIPIAYGLGLLFEFIGLISVEWLLNIIKRRRIGEYYSKETQFVKDNPIFRDYKSDASKRIRESYHGEMRFYVLLKSSELYSIIETELNWLRLTRVLFIVELILLAGIVVKIAQNKVITIPLLLFHFAILFVIFIATGVVIFHRFGRYCRAIERSFKILMLENVGFEKIKKIKNKKVK